MNLDDTDNCPRDDKCYLCQSTMDLCIGVYGTTLGVFCATICDTCAHGPTPESPGYGPALMAIIRRIEAHCGHLGITLDQMAAVMEAERRSE